MSRILVQSTDGSGEEIILKKPISKLVISEEDGETVLKKRGGRWNEVRLVQITEEVIKSQNRNINKPGYDPWAGGFGIGTIFSDHQPSKPKFDFRGLWYTSKHRFIQIGLNNQAVELNEDGTYWKLVHIDINGNSEEAGQLDCAKIGEEEYVSSEKEKGRLVRWPIIKKQPF